MEDKVVAHDSDYKYQQLVSLIKELAKTINKTISDKPEPEICSKNPAKFDEYFLRIGERQQVLVYLLEFISLIESDERNRADGS